MTALVRPGLPTPALAEVCGVLRRRRTIISQPTPAARNVTTYAAVNSGWLTQPAVKRLIEPAEVAELVAYLCSPAGSFANGSSFVLGGGWSAR